jgi:hypothetical protein
LLAEGVADMEAPKTEGIQFYADSDDRFTAMVDTEY